MSAQAFQIICPVCGSIVPASASACATCAAGGAHGVVQRAAPTSVATGVSLSSASSPELTGLSLKDYHRMVRDNHRVVEGGWQRSGFRFSAVLPLVLLVALGLVVAVALVEGWL